MNDNKIAALVKELGSVSFTALCTMVQWDGVCRADCAMVVESLKKDGVLEERGGELRCVGPTPGEKLCARMTRVIPVWARGCELKPGPLGDVLFFKKSHLEPSTTCIATISPSDVVSPGQAWAQVLGHFDVPRTGWFVSRVVG